MKNIVNWILSGIILIIFSFCVKDFFIIKTITSNQLILQDSIRKMNFEKYYISENLKLNFENSGKKISNFELYTVEDIERLQPFGIEKILSSNKRKIVLRYTEIGCNTCADKTLKLLKERDDLKNKYDIYVFADFSDFSNYVKWKKLADVSYDVFIVEKGDLPFYLEKEKMSYLFVLDSDNTVLKIIMPDYLFLEHTNDFINRL